MDEPNANYELAIKKAEELLEFCGYDEPPVDPANIARQLGLTVYFSEFDKETDRYVSGFYSSKENAIHVNKNEIVARQTFTIAHELGHYQMHRDWAESKDYKILYREQLTKKQTDPKEKEANAFAANLLVPKSMLKKYRNYASISELARLFVVSESVIKFRLINIKFLGKNIEYGYGS